MAPMIPILLKTLSLIAFFPSCFYDDVKVRYFMWERQLSLT